MKRVLISVCFTFANWSQSCQSQLEFCIRAIAVHEFGHALGFAHEQNRPSTSTEPAQGSSGNLMIGAWDLQSVMNYCYPNWNGHGQLSATDIACFVQLYGAALSIREFGYNQGWRVEQHPRTAADVNGDGRADIIGFGNAGVHTYLYLRPRGRRRNQLQRRQLGPCAGSVSEPGGWMGRGCS